MLITHVPDLRRRIRQWLFCAVLLALMVLATACVGSAAAAPGWQSPLRPLQVTRPFERPPTPYAAGHRGVDRGGGPGDEVRAAADGQVSFAGSIAGRGVVVVVHGDLRTTYEPLRASVRRGAHVRGGEAIGSLEAGHRGCPVAACLHWGLLRANVYLDPLSLISARSVRLLPPAGLQAARVVDGVGAGPSPTTWSLVALSGAGALVAFSRR